MHGLVSLAAFVGGGLALRMTARRQCCPDFWLFSPCSHPCSPLQREFAKLLRDASEGLPVGGRKPVWEAGRPTVVHGLTAQVCTGLGRVCGLGLACIALACT